MTTPLEKYFWNILQLSDEESQAITESIVVKSSLFHRW